MLEYKRLTKHRRKFLALTGLTPKEFKLLLPAFCEVYEEARAGTTTQSGTPRQRMVGGGRKGQLRLPEEKLLFILIYQKAYPLQTLLGEVFELSQARVNYWVHHLLPLLQQALAALELLPEREPRQFAPHERAKKEPPALIIDGTERRRQRPKSPEKQALHYSGKHKTHSDKNVVVVNAKTKRVGYLSQTYAGKTHDKKIADQEAICYPRDAILYQDTGFQGYEPSVGQTRQPKKSPAKAHCHGARSDTIGHCRGSG
jgi:DDE superfamily endonuclease/Helix-turn-helix of DDE superfamily endonuclease